MGHSLLWGESSVKLWCSMEWLKLIYMHAFCLWLGWMWSECRCVISFRLFGLCPGLNTCSWRTHRGLRNIIPTLLLKKGRWRWRSTVLDHYEECLKWHFSVWFYDFSLCFSNVSRSATVTQYKSVILTWTLKSNISELKELINMLSGGL